MPEQDPFEELRGAWQGLDAPDPTPERADEETQAVVDTLRAAWNALEAPAVQVPKRTRFRLLRGPWLQAAAALLVIAGSTVLVRFAMNKDSQEQPERTESRVAQVETTEPTEPTHSEVTSVPAPADPELQEHVRAVEPAPIESGLVMTHGKVRLVMLTAETNYEPIDGTQDLENPK